MFTRRTLLSLFLVGMMFLGSSAPVCASTKLTAGAIGTTSDTYMLAMGWANALNEVGSSVSITPLEGGGTVQLLRGLVSNRWDIGFIGSPHYGNALAGELNFEKDPPELRERYKKARVLFGILSGMGQYVVRGDSDIYSVADLKGKKISIGTPGGMAGLVTRRLFHDHGLSHENNDYSPQYLEYSTALDEMRSNLLDATLLWGGIPQVAAFNFSRQIPVRFLPINEKAFASFKENMPGGRYYILKEYTPENLKAVYGEEALVQKEPANMWTFQMMVIVREDMPEEIAYEITKQFWENLDFIKETGSALKALDSNEALKDLSAEFHPGAVRYYKEKGWL
ncbi:TAXI family TRAP transporter solute-binding subunit [Aminivibrio sp.]|jgi:TRAP transporter TAXI family solute receptor|uniref:TAXI family TRAP transporter solute-binding subunit n=1 Tax=Aminivibrio sp. TaxID=1872489 RepID=UPI003D97232A